MDPRIFIFDPTRTQPFHQNDRAASHPMHNGKHRQTRFPSVRGGADIKLINDPYAYHETTSLPHTKDPAFAKPRAAFKIWSLPRGSRRLLTGPRRERSIFALIQISLLAQYELFVMMSTRAKITGFAHKQCPHRLVDSTRGEESVGPRLLMRLLFTTHSRCSRRN
jgi:hypothetical protein